VINDKNIMIYDSIYINYLRLKSFSYQRIIMLNLMYGHITVKNSIF